MKKMLLLAMICLNSIVSARKNYELFSFESKSGVVETNSLDEFIAPTFPDYSRTFDAIGLVDGSKYTFVDRKTGETETLLYNGDRLRFNGNYYQHFSKDGKSVFISKEVKNRIQFEKNYSAAIGDGSNLYVKHDGLFEVFAAPNFTKPKLKNINAKKIYLDYLFRKKKTNNEENLVVFYGGDTISVYDKSFNLLKQYPIKEQYESRMLNAIAENFTKIEKEDWNAVAPMPEYFRRKSENGYTTFTSIKKDVSFTAKGDFWNSVIYGEEDIIILIDRKNELRYSFKIDFEKKRFLIPEKYQDLLELKFI